MGKTFVALAVATSVALEDRTGPVVVMVPPSLKHKWPTDFELFRERCLPAGPGRRLRVACAQRAVEFLKLLDDPPEKRRHIIFVTHGALSHGLHDRWAMLALIRQALWKRHNVGRLRRALSRQMAELLGMHWLQRQPESFWLALLETPPNAWLDLLHLDGVDPENDDDPTTDDDPVPEAVSCALGQLDTQALFEALHSVPRKRSEHYQKRLRACRALLKRELRKLWKQVAQRWSFTLPLLILDEAHHLKNAQTRLASLFFAPARRRRTPMRSRTARWQGCSSACCS